MTWKNKPGLENSSVNFPYLKTFCISDPPLQLHLHGYLCTLCLFIKLVFSLDIVVTDFCNLIWYLDTYILKYWFNLLPSKYFSSARRCKIKSRFAQNYAPRLCWEQCIGERFCLSNHSIQFSPDAIFTLLRTPLWAVGHTHAFSWEVLECAAGDTV